MGMICLHDKPEIEQFLRRSVRLHIYSIGDLDDFFWPHTTWYGYKTDRGLEAIALVYAGPDLPTVLALSDSPDAMAELLGSILNLLPDRFYAHLSPGLERTLEESFELESLGAHSKMALAGIPAAAKIDCAGVELLSMDDLPAIEALYSDSYPGNWFDPRMLETDHYFGIADMGRLVSIAGIHVYSRRYRVAALGNITTLPTHQGRGLATRVTAKLCQSLLEEGIEVGLNVKADNHAAVSCYRKIGFETVAAYEEFAIRRRR
jgi:GNAT superfamily N-acetyltransferase